MPVKAMDEILQQLVPLLIGSIPTILIFLTLVLSYKFLLHGPLLKVLAERRARTEGAVGRAHAAIAAADAKAQEYEARLRAARAEIFHAREARVKTWNAERESALASARRTARERVHAAKAEIDVQADSSKQEIQRSADTLAADILRAVLPADFSAAVAEGPR
jgi:F-type H+-transporting ATPase subunit b